MTIIAQRLDIPVEGGMLRVLRFGDGPNLVIGLHGIAASGMVWRVVARQLPPGWALVAPDLRGRGESDRVPGPYGFRRHVADLHRVIQHLGARRVALAGHSIGAYVALLAGARHPGLFHRVVLVDGGLPLPVPAGADIDQMLSAILGPVLSRLRETFPSRQSYLDFWRAHPAFADAWTDDVEAYVSYDIAGPPGALRARALEAAVRHDGRDLLTGGMVVEAALRGVTIPALLLTAPNGMDGTPPGLVREPMAAHWRGQVPSLGVEAVKGSNHYTILLQPEAAATVAERLVDQASWPANWSAPKEREP
jgi:lipase